MLPNSLLGMNSSSSAGMAACRLPPRARLLPLLLAALCSAAIVSGQVPPGLPGPPPPLRRPWFATDLEELLAAARGRSPVGLPVGWLNTTFASNPTPGNDAASADNRDAALPQPAVSWPWRSEYRWVVGGGGGHLTLLVPHCTRRLRVARRYRAPHTHTPAGGAGQCICKLLCLIRR